MSQNQLRRSNRHLPNRTVKKKLLERNRKSSVYRESVGSLVKAPPSPDSSYHPDSDDDEDIEDEGHRRTTEDNCVADDEADDEDDNGKDNFIDNDHSNNEDNSNSNDNSNDEDEVNDIIDNDAKIEDTEPFEQDEDLESNHFCHEMTQERNNKPPPVQNVLANNGGLPVYTATLPEVVAGLSTVASTRNSVTNDNNAHGSKLGTTTLNNPQLTKQRTDTLLKYHLSCPIPQCEISIPVSELCFKRFSDAKKHKHPLKADNTDDRKIITTIESPEGFSNTTSWKSLRNHIMEKHSHEAVLLQATKELLPFFKKMRFTTIAPPNGTADQKTKNQLKNAKYILSQKRNASLILAAFKSKAGKTTQQQTERQSRWKQFSVMHPPNPKWRFTVESKLTAATNRAFFTSRNYHTVEALHKFHQALVWNIPKLQTGTSLYQKIQVALKTLASTHCVRALLDQSRQIQLELSPMEILISAAYYTTLRIDLPFWDEIIRTTLENRGVKDGDVLVDIENAVPNTDESYFECAVCNINQAITDEEQKNHVISTLSTWSILFPKIPIARNQTFEDPSIRRDVLPGVIPHLEVPCGQTLSPFVDILCDSYMRSTPSPFGINYFTFPSLKK